MMWNKVTFIILTLVPWIVAVDRDKHRFLGGTISYTTKDLGGGQYQADVELITGWVLGTGPCGDGCNNNMIGTSTLPMRKQIETATADPYFFGRFFEDKKANCSGVSCIDNTIKDGMTEEVFALNTEAKWEQAIAKFSITYNGTLDVNFDGDFWRPLTLQAGSLKWHLQAEFSTKIRNDTQKPNSLPGVIGRPYYRVKLNTTTIIRMAVSDADGDELKCYRAEFVEGGAISTHFPPGVEVQKDCQVKIITSMSNGYADDAWIAVAVVIRDYNKETITYEGATYNPYANSIAYSSFQFVVNVLEHLSPPQFVSPTPPNTHTFLLYIGALWTTEIYAEASENTTIASFQKTARGFDGSMSTLKDDPKRDRVKYVTLTWMPSVSNIGTQTLCITARDDTGVDSAEDMCMLLHVIPDKFDHRQNAPYAGRPVFIDIPTPTQVINCPIHTTCFVPLHIRSAVNVTEVRIEKFYTYDAKVGTVQKFIILGTDVYKTDLSFRDTSHGEKQLCLVAIDINGVESDETCIMTEIEPPNPCASNPCRNSGVCSMDKRTGTFVCRCLPHFSGKRCEIDGCTPNPCQHGGLCSVNKCRCFPEYTGRYCEIDINYCTANATCSNHGTCKDGASDYTCECIDRFKDSLCQTDKCPSEDPTKGSCPITGCVGIDCNGHGLCMAGGVCRCSSGYTGSQCETPKGNMSLLNNEEVAFVSPTLQAGSTLVVHVIGNKVSPNSVDAFIVTRSGDKPTIGRRLSPALDVNSTTVDARPSVNVPGITGMYYAHLIIKGNVASMQEHFACISASHGTTTVERCYRIKLVPDPKLDHTSLQFAQKDAGMRFIDPTPKDGSVILCTKNVQCDLLLYTNDSTNAHKCPDVITTTKDVLVFKSHHAGTVGPCIAEVSFMFNGNVDKEICFQSALVNYQQRCFQVRLYEPNSDPCNSTSCYNGGHCIRTSQDDFICECPANFVGDKCQKGPCKPAENNCKNNGYCQRREDLVSCICKLGFTGDTCNRDSGNSTLTSTAEFTDTAKPDIFQCVIDQPCSISLILSGTFPANKRPTVAFGYLPPVFEVIQLNTNNLPTNNRLFQTSLILKGRQKGLYKTCLQTQNHIGTTTDEMCFKINVITDVISVNALLDRPYFMEPSLPTDTTVKCAENSVCHVLYQALPGTGNNDKCVSNNPTVSDDSLGFHLFTTCDQCNTGNTGSGNCTIDFSFTTPIANGQTITACLELSITSLNLLGEKRCFDLSILKSADALAKKGCQQLQCTNGGFCDGRNEDNPFCVCRRGFAGTTCQKDAMIVDPSGMSSTNFIGDSAIPREIMCRVMQFCAIPFQVVHKPGENTTFEFGYTDHRLAIVTKMSNDNSSIKRTLLIPNKPGLFNICQQLSAGSLTADEICTTVNVQGTPESVDPTRPSFSLPTPASETTMLCNVRTSCHLDIHYKLVNDSANHQICPDLVLTEETTVDKLHIFDVPSTTAKECIKDVSIIHETEEVLRLCLQVVLPGKRGELRCFNIHFVNDVSSEVQHPCRGMTCLNGGKCLAVFRTSIPTQKCMCQHGFSGDSCQNVDEGKDILPGVVSPTTQTASQYFDSHSAIPTHVNCKGIKPCCIDIPYYGKNFLPPLISFKGNGLKVESDIVYTPLHTNPQFHIVTRCFTGPSGQTERVCYQTTSDGTNKSVNVDEMCFEMEFTPPGTLPAGTNTDKIAALPDGTTLSCLPNTVCHIPIRTDLKSGNCGSVKLCGQGMPGVHIFPSTNAGGTCLTDVAIATGKDGITDTLCISSGGDDRHITVDSKSPSNQGYSPCQKLHCLNGGVCKAQAKLHAVCECPSKYSGAKCEKVDDNVCNGIQCMNDGQCVTEGTGTSIKGVCLCTSGFSGNNCSTHETNTSGIPGVQGLPSGVTVQQNFLGDNAVPKAIHCDSNRKCCIPIQYSGSKDQPPIFGHIDHDLTVVSELQTVVTQAGIHVAVTCVKGVAGKTQRLCLQTTTNGTKQGMNVDEICVNINTKPGGLTNPSESSFTNSLPNGTNVMCQSNSQCHIPVITTAKLNTCDQVQNCGNQGNGVHAFTTKLVDGTCITDVVVKTGPAGSTDALCLSSGSNGSTLQLHVDVKDPSGGFGGPCQKTHCRNGGSCLATNETFATCNCAPGYTGYLCSQKDKCTCFNGGLCVDINSVGTCICTSDFLGNNCETAIDKAVAFPGTKNIPSNIQPAQQFITRSAIPTTVNCDEVNPCCISIPYYGDKDLPPIVGYTTTEIVSGPVSVTPDRTKPDIHFAKTCVKGHAGETNRLCLHTTSDGTKTGINVDEICVQVHVQSGGQKSATSPSVPHFTESLPDKSTVVCQPHCVCHIPVTTANLDGTCYKVTNCANDGKTLLVVSAKPVGNECVSDIAIVTQSSGVSFKICVSAGTGGEEREISVDVKDSTDSVGFGPCGQKHCLNGGHCKSYTSLKAVCACPAQYTGDTCLSTVGQTACPTVPCNNGGMCINDSTSSHNVKCACAVGFTGSICDKVEVQLPLPTVNTDINHIAQTFFNNSALPQHVKCFSDKPCCLPIPYHGNKDLPPLIGYHDNYLTVLPEPDVVTIGSGSDSTSHVAEICVEGKTGKVHRLCMQTTTNGTEQGVNLDEICIEIEVKPPSSNQQNQNVAPGPHFNNTLPDGTEVICKPNTLCHVPITTDTTDGICEQVTTCSPGQTDVHALQTHKVGDKCVTDVAVKAPNQENGKTNLCLSAGSNGEELNLVVKATQDNAFGPCRDLHCQNGGTCVSMKSGNPAVCQCPSGLTGTECQAGIGSCTLKNCLNGGLCKSYTSGVPAVCACPSQFTGDSCQSAVQGQTACPSVPCKNGGMCINDGTTSNNMKCACAVGFTGSICDKVEVQLPLPVVTDTTTDNSTASSHTNTSPATPYNTDVNHIPQTFFNNSALPQFIQCVAAKPCCLPIPYHGNKDLPPMLGYHNDDLTVLPVHDVVTIGSGSGVNSHVAEICVEGKPGKVHRLCMQTTTNGTREGINLDEICVEIEVKPPSSNQQHQQVAPGPHFKNSLPDGTEVICKSNALCHVPVTTDTTGGICEQVTTCSLGQTDVHALQTQKVDDKCVTDVVVKAPNQENGKTNICLSAGAQGEELNLVVKATHNSAFGPCRELHCLNGGMCLSKEAGIPAVCECPADYTGTECETGPQCSKDDADADKAKTMVIDGHVSCSCIVNGKEVNIVKKRPAAKKENIYSAAGFGAGGMVGSMVVGVVIYFIVNKLRKPTKSIRPRSPSSKVHPKVDPKRKQENVRNMDF